MTKKRYVLWLVDACAYSARRNKMKMTPMLNLKCFTDNFCFVSFLFSFVCCTCRRVI